VSNLSDVITQLELAWKEIQSEHEDLPDAVITSSRRRQKSERQMRGQHCTNVWKVGDVYLAEITIFGERFFDGAAQVMQTLLHEAAHALAQVREIKDTSNKGRFHNKKFVLLAEEVGLEAPAESGGTALGWSDCTITEATRTLYETSIAGIDSVLKMYIPPVTEDEEEKEKKPTQKAACECPSEKEGEDFNTITWAKWMQKKLDAYGIPPLLCGVCRQAFNPIPLEDEADTP
jgi:hypothetical protein